MTKPTIDPASRDALLRYEKSLDCVHCGLCLSACPTFQVTGHEGHSPRGRIHLMRALAEDRITLDDPFREKMEGCLVCRACESVCPSGVAYGRMMEITRHEMARRQPSWLARFLLRRLVPHPGRLRFAAGALALARGTGLLALARGLARARLLPRTLRTWIDQTPALAPRRDRQPLPLTQGPEADVAVDTVAFFEGCVMRPLFGDVNRAAVASLVAQGVRVVVPAGQTCCGALHAHAGDQEGARGLARQNLAAFEAALAAGASTIVLDSAGCGAALKDWSHWLEGDDAERAEALAARALDLSVYLSRRDHRPRPRPELRGRTLTWDAPCHLEHAQGHREEAPDLLRRIEGATFVPLSGCSDCCGGAGSYSLTQAAMSDAILEAKLDRLVETGADLLVTANPGCILQWRRGIERRGLAVEVRHLAELM